MRKRSRFRKQRAHGTEGQMNVSWEEAFGRQLWLYCNKRNCVNVNEETDSCSEPYLMISHKH